MCCRAGILKRLVLKGVGGVALSPVGHVLAAWVPEAKVNVIYSVGFSDDRLTCTMLSGGLL